MMVGVAELVKEWNWMSVLGVGGMSTVVLLFSVSGVGGHKTGMSFRLERNT